MISERKTKKEERGTGSSAKPIYLFADSQLLFWKENGFLFLESLRNSIKQDSPSAVYVGASNGDNPDLYSIFEAAMQGIGINQNRMILSGFSTDEAVIMDRADIILLAGGDAEAGWRILESSGLRECIARRYSEGSLLIGVSAGAVQLGTRLPPSPDSLNDPVKSFELVPFIISTHDEGSEWSTLTRTVQTLGNGTRGIGIATGAGAIYHVDGSIQPIRLPLDEYTAEGSRLSHRVLLPPVDTMVD